MAKMCPLCCGKISGMIKFKVRDGEICGICANLNPSYQTSSIQDMQQLLTRNKERVRNFSKTNALKSLMSECVVIDDTHRWFAVTKNEKTPPYFVYSFDEIVGYEFQEAGGKVITKNKGGIGRAVVGGALFGGVGAIVGAATSSTETKKAGAINLLKVYIETPVVRKTLTLTSPPTGFTAFLDRCIHDQPRSSGETLPTLSAADEIKKFKALLDDGILTQEEFDTKKKQLLGL